MRDKGYFLLQPHQPFFVLGVVNAVIFMALFGFLYSGVMTTAIDPLLFHAYSTLFLIFTPFFIGFLLTTYPRFSQTDMVEKGLYTKIFYLYIGASLSLVLSLFHSFFIHISTILVLITQIVVLLAFFKRYKASFLPDKSDLFWINVGWSMGIVANIALFFTSIDLIDIRRSATIGVYLYLIFLAFTVAQRMVPFFSHVMIEKNRNLLKQLSLLFLLGVVIKLFNLKVEGVFFIVAGVLVLKELFRWKLPTKGAPPILWILHIAVYWLPLALIVGGISMIWSALGHPMLGLALHLVVLGFLNTIFIGFGTRVTLGHSGNPMAVDNYTKILFYLTQLLVYFRAIFSFSGSTILFVTTITLWLILFSAWAAHYFGVLIFGKQLTHRK